MKVIKVIGLVVLSILVLGIVGISVFTGVQVADGMILQNEGKDTHEASLYQLEEWSFDYEAFETQYPIVKSSISQEDGYEIPMVIIGGDQLSKDKTVLLVHPLGGDYMCVYPQAKIYLEEGYDVVAIDQRGSGASKDKRVTFGHYEQEDLLAVVEYIKSVKPESELVLHGVSMGAATVGLYSSSDHGKAHIKAAIMDSSFGSMKDMFVLAMANMDVDIPLDFMISTGNIMMKIKYGLDFSDANILEQMSDNQVPTLIIHSAEDSLVTDEVSFSMYDAIPHKNKEMWTVDAKHIEGIIDFPIEYKQTVFNFIENY